MVDPRMKKEGVSIYLSKGVSIYLSAIGEEVLITDRGKPIARIVCEKDERRSVRASLADLVEKGTITLPGKNIDIEQLGAVDVPGRPISEIVIEDRR